MTASACRRARSGRDWALRSCGTLIQGELGGTIDWHTLEGEGTEVTIDMPTLWLEKAVS